MNTTLIFPGQGSQSVGMLADLADTKIVQDVFDQSSEALGYDLLSLCQNGPEDELNQTHRTQPAILATSIAFFNLLHDKGTLDIQHVAGHSLGEYTALVASGVVDLVSAIKLVEKRGLYMQEAVPAGQGAMAAILGLEDADVESACDEASEGAVVSAVNYNSPGQVVIAGEKAAVERAVSVATNKGAKKAVLLPVSVPSHCALMKPASDKLADDLRDIEFNAPRIPLINNVSAAVESDASLIKEALVKQLYCPVRWTEVIAYATNAGTERYIECGPGKVLTGLMRRIDRRANATFAHDAASIEKIYS